MVDKYIITIILFCRNCTEVEDSETRRHNVQNNLNTDFSANNTLDLSFSHQNQPAKTDQPPVQHQKFVLDRSRRQFNVQPPSTTANDDNQEPSFCSTIIQRVSLTYFAQNYYGKWLCCVQVKVISFLLSHFISFHLSNKLYLYI